MTRHRIGNGPLQVDLEATGARTSRITFHGRDLILPMADQYDRDSLWSHVGAVIGPVANRFTATRDVPGWVGPEDGRVILHGDCEGLRGGLHHLLWNLSEATPERARFTIELPHGEGGFAAKRRLTASYSLPAPDVLRLTLTATSDAPCLMTLTHHPYWHLGERPGSANHRLTITADAYLPIDALTRPTGEVRAVKGTGFDFTQGNVLCPDTPPLDNTFCLSSHQTSLRPVATLQAPDGWAMALRTTEPGLIVFDGRITDAFGQQPYAALCLEPQFWPDGPRHPRFPDATLLPGHTRQSVIEYHFTAPDQVI